MCRGAPNFDETVFCCSPETGSLIRIDDQFPCTEDLCDFPSGSCVGVPTVPGVFGQEIIARGFCDVDPALTCLVPGDCPAGGCSMAAFEWPTPVSYEYVIGDFVVSSDLTLYPFFFLGGGFGDFFAHPECKFTKPISLGIACPENECKGNISARRSKKGRTFYGCTEYPNCKFVSWDKPVAEACPECAHPYMVEKWKKNEGESIVCPNKECGFKKSAA